jgi:hypothetical protein
MIGGDYWLFKKTGGCQSSRPKDHRINQVYNVWLKLLQTAYEEGTEEVKLEFRVKWQRESCRTNYLRSSIPLHTTLRSEKQHPVSIGLQVF